MHGHVEYRRNQNKHSSSAGEALRKTSATVFKNTTNTGLVLVGSTISTPKVSPF